MRQMLVMGNWKMNGSCSELTALLQRVTQQAEAFTKVDVAVCPSFVYLEAMNTILTGSKLGLGAQDVSVHKTGAYTGEISAAMLKDLGCHYTLVGHSERRSYHTESNELVAEKFIAAQSESLTPVLCIGETLEERQAGKMQEVVTEQIKAVIERVSANAFAKAVIAYEPVWAIGTGIAAEPSDVQAAHGFLRSLLRDYAPELAENMQILYGGSVKASNAAEILSQADVDGGLVGGASLKADEFIAICQAANSE